MTQQQKRQIQYHTNEIVRSIYRRGRDIRVKFESGLVLSYKKGNEDMLMEFLKFRKDKKCYFR